MARAFFVTKTGTLVSKLVRISGIEKMTIKLKPLVNSCGSISGNEVFYGPPI